MQTLTLEKNIPVEINTHDIHKLLKSLKYHERMQLLMVYLDELLDFSAKEEKITPMTVEEYNQKLEESEEAIKEGRVYTNDEMLNQINSWKKAASN